VFVHVGAKPYKIEARLDKVDSVRGRCECVAIHGDLVVDDL